MPINLNPYASETIPYKVSLLFDVGSSSVSGIIHGIPSVSGDGSNSTFVTRSKGSHYIDGIFWDNLALERFQRDYATIDKQEREYKRQHKEEDY